MPDRIKEIDNLHIIGSEELPAPGALKDEMALQGIALETVRGGHRAVKNVLDGKDPRLIVVVGPCSIHNPEEAMEYARLLKPLADELADEGTIRVNSLNPGRLRTAMRASAYPAEDPASLRRPEEVTNAYLFLLGRDSADLHGLSLDAQAP